MAQQKQRVLITIVSRLVGCFTIWVDGAEDYLSDVQSIEGVHKTITGNVSIDVFIDPRYSIDEIIQEVELLLVTEDVPEAFKIS